MEGVADKLCWDVYLRVGKPIPIPHPLWQVYRDMADEIHEIIAPTRDQLEEDTKWKE